MVHMASRLQPRFRLASRRDLLVAGRKWFLDVNAPARTLVVHLKLGAGYDAIAVTVDDPSALVADLGSRAGLTAS